MYVQIVKFKLKPETSRESFLELAGKMITWLKDRHGLLGYELYEGVDFWFDRIVWRNQQAAQEGLNDFLNTGIASELVRLVEDDYSSFFGQIVRKID